MEHTKKYLTALLFLTLVTQVLLTPLASTPFLHYSDGSVLLVEETDTAELEHGDTVLHEGEITDVESPALSPAHTGDSVVLEGQDELSQPDKEVLISHEVIP